MNSANCLHSVVMLICFLYAGCEDITVNLGETRNISVLSGKSVKLTCIHSSSIDTNQPRRWYENTDLIISGGIVANSNSGYSETVGTDRFTLTTPAVNDSFVGYKYTCRYVFDEGYFYLTAVEKQMSTEGTVTTVHTTKTTTNSSTSSIDTTTASTSANNTCGLLCILLSVLGACGFLIIIIIMIIIVRVKRRGKKDLENDNVSKMQGITGHENEACKVI